MKDFCGSIFWDSDLTWNTEDPDFTSCFLQTALAWTPSVLLAVLAPFDIYFAFTSRYSNIPWNGLNISRLVITCALAVLMLSDIIVAATWESSDLFDVHIVTPVVKLVTFILAAGLALYNRKRGIVSSGYLFSYWFTVCMLSIPQFRHEIRAFERRPINTFTDADQLSWADYEFLSFMIFFPLLCIQLILHLWADQKPRDTTYAKSDGTNPSPEPFAGFLQTILFTWFDMFAWTGYRRSLEAEDMWDINPNDRSDELVPVFDHYWKRSVARNANKKRPSSVPKGAVPKNGKPAPPTTDNRQATNGSIVPVLFSAFGGTFFYSGILKLVIDLLSFANPQILGLLIAFIANPLLPAWHGILYAVVLLLLATATSLLNGQYQFEGFLIGYRIRTVLISAIYRKALTISTAAKRNTTVGEIVNLMAVDAQRFFELIVYLHILWSGPLVIALCIFFLWQILGIASLSGLVVMILMIPLNGYVANKLKYFQLKQMTKKDERVKMMNEVLSGMKVLKLYAWEASFEEAINKIRNKELQIIKHSAVVNAYVFFIWNMIPFLVTLVSFTVFVFADPENNKITPSTVFVSLSLFNILRMPMTMFPIMITMVMQAYVSVVRINKFLNSEDLDAELVTNRSDTNAVRISKASFTWGEDEPVLKNINLQVPKGTIAAIVGPVGSGKSSLVASVLGETERVSGEVNVDGSMAYVAQQAWIQNATLRDNILFGKPYDRNFYQSVLEACALVQDLKILPGGDQTEIGEKGINLSGGQKQRVALARAVYARADIYLLDDPLSAVDSHVGKHIFDNVLGPAGILAKSTRLLVTHGISYLPRCDTIFVLSAGTITESGQYAQLLASRGAFADFIVQHLQGTDDEEELLEIKQALTDTAQGEKLFQRAISQISNGNGTISQRKMSTMSTGRRVSILSTGRRQSTVSKGRKFSRTTSQLSEKQPPKDGVKLINKEEAAVGSVGIGVYLRYIRSIGWAFVSLAFVLSIVNQVVQVYSNTWLSQWSAREDANEPEVRDLYLGVFGGLGIVQAIAMFGTSLVMALGCLNAARVLHFNLLFQVMRLPMAFFDTTPLGRIMNRFSKDVDVVDVILPERIRTWMFMVFNAIAILVVISIQTPIFLAVIVPLAVFYYFIQVFYVATSRQLKRIESVTRSPIYSHFGESITGQSTIRAYGAQARFTHDSVRRVDFNQQCSYPAIIAARWLAIRLEIIGGFVIFFAALFAVLNRNEVGGESVGLSITYALQITSVLSWLVRFTADVETNIVANERLEEYTAVPTEAPWVTKKMDPQWPQVGAVKFTDYKVRYREGLDLVLRGIDVSIEGGQRVGIVGRTGAGKSSLTLALFRIIESAGGSISIDGVPIHDIGLHSLRSRLTIIPQDPVLFSGTLRMNIDPFTSYSDEQIWTALEHAHLKAYVKTTSTGLLHEIAEGGENLSIGQRQLVCLARALLRKTKVLILDEATAAVDLETDDLIQRTIREQFSDCTVLTIAHRLNTILDSDRVLVLDAGVVAEFESPRSLLDNSKSIFHGMAKDAGLVYSNGSHVLSS